MMEVDVESGSVLDMVPIGLFTLGPDLVIRSWNRTLEGWTGRSREEMIGHHLGEFYPHVLELRYAGRLEDVFHLGTPAVFSSQLHPHLIPVTLPGGRRQQQNVTVTAIRLDERMWGALVAIEDVTALVDQIGLYREMRDRALEEVECRRHKESELQRRNRELSVLHAATTTITSPGTLRDRLVCVLKYLLSHLGFEAGLVQLLDYEDVEGPLQVHSGLSPNGMEATRALVSIGRQQARDGHDREAMEAEIREVLSEAIRGEEYPTVYLLPLVAEEQLVGILALMSSVKHAFDDSERTLIESIAREIGTAVGKASLEGRLRDAHDQTNLYLDILTHDIGNTVTTISGATELLAMQMEPPDQGPLTQVQRGIGKVTKIIRNVSTIRQIHEQELVQRPIRLDDLVRSEVEVFPGARIINEVPPIEILADQLLSEVFTNLIGNSLKHGGRDVTIWIRARQIEGGIECSVEDDGPGIPDEQKTQIFERFEMPGGKSTGHGLGLYITRSLVERYGGSCRITDRVNGRPEEGAAVRFTLVTGETHRDHPVASGAPPPVTRERKREKAQEEVHRT
ncbi:Adaptive-response sensory-kinase SasA [anaerobic digester metagenome]